MRVRTKSNANAPAAGPRRTHLARREPRAVLAAQNSLRRKAARARPPKTLGGENT